MSWPDKSGVIDHSALVHLWRQVYEDVTADIRSGRLQPGAKLPAELDLADSYQVSRDVIRRAKEELVTEGWIVVLQGRGTFVTPAHRWPAEP